MPDYTILILAALICAVLAAAAYIATRLIEGDDD